MRACDSFQSEEENLASGMAEETRSIICTRSNAAKCCGEECGFTDASWKPTDGVEEKGPFAGLIVSQGLWRCDADPHHVVCCDCMYYVDLTLPVGHHDIPDFPPDESGLYCKPCQDQFGLWSAITWKREVCRGRFCLWEPNRRSAA